MTAVRCRSPLCKGRQVSDRRPFCADHIAIFNRLREEMDKPEKRPKPFIAPKVKPIRHECRLIGCSVIAAEGEGTACHLHLAYGEDETHVRRAGVHGECWYGCRRNAKSGTYACRPCAASGEKVHNCTKASCGKAATGLGGFCAYHDRHLRLQTA